MEYLKEIIHYFKDSDIGIGLDLDPENKVAIIFSEKVNIEEIFVTLSENVTFVAENIQPYEHLKAKYPSLNLVEGNIINTNLNDNSLDFIVVDSGLIELEWESVRSELKRISSKSGYCDIVIIDESAQKSITDDFLEYLYAGSWYEVKEFGSGRDKFVKIYQNPIGFNKEELKIKEITEFINACEDYCKVIENFNQYTVKDFLYNVQKTLVNYYSKGFDLPNCNGSDGNKEISTQYTKKDVNNYWILEKSLNNYLDKHNTYWSNFNPYPDDNDKEIYTHSLSGDLAEIYEDIKLNLIAYEKGNIYDKQDIIWDWKFNWNGHTGDHWTFAVRAIHWKLQDLEYED